ncbi:DUF4367 domain-containing protein [Brevibacillus sp. B_LB10_24]|uniref:DUF4367 domain-containing protein n=1 Tax=Brevibacillus sp. B_LB10_24 TaxID=3380645 RepID=UPI0038B9A107
MRGIPYSPEEQSLKNMDRLPQNASNVQAFEVTDQVMDRIYRKSQAKFPSAVPRRFRPGIAAPALVAVTVLAVAAAGYAASQYLEFRNGKGDVVLSTDVTNASVDDAKHRVRVEEAYREEAKSRLQPGEYAAYYVKDDTVSNLQIAFVYREAEVSSFDRLQEEAKRTGTPLFTSPVHLPDGYQFNFGYVYPIFTFPDTMDSAEYQALTDELIRKAQAVPEGEKLVTHKLNPNPSDLDFTLTFARYAKGKDYVNIEASKYDPETTFIEVMQNGQDTAEKLTIHGIKAYYIQAGEGSQPLKAGKNRLGWLDEQRGLHFTLSDNQDSPLTKEELIRIAEDLMTPQR